MSSKLKGIKILVAAVLAFEGLSLALLSSKVVTVYPWMRIVGAILFIGCTWYVIRTLGFVKLPTIRPSLPRNQKKLEASKLKLGTKRSKVAYGDILFIDKLMDKLPIRRISIYVFPVIGALIIDAVLMFNMFTYGHINLQSMDIVTILFGITLIAYNFVPSRFAIARDFALFFFGILFLVLIAPLLIYGFTIGTFGGSSAWFTYHLLAIPLAAMLNLLGIPTQALPHDEYGEPIATIIFYVQPLGKNASLGITEACSGIYTASVFLAAFVTYVLIEYRRVDKRVLGLLTLGVLTAYFANILRMTVIVVTGHLYGMGALQWMHANAGWLIFLGWISLFWWLMFKFLVKRDEVVDK